MKTKILSILLTVAMLVAMVPMIAVSAEEETGTIVEVGSIEKLDEFMASADNAIGNTMKLTADLDYSYITDLSSESRSNGLWAKNNKWLLANVDGNGHTVTIPGVTYTACVLNYLTGADANYTIKNLKVQMATKDGVQAVATGNDISLFAGRYRTTLFASASFENCYFDVNFNCTGTDPNNGTAILFGVNNEAAAKEWALNVTNCYFKMHAEVVGGRHGALLGSTFSTATNKVTMTVVNSVFDVTYTKAENLAEGTICAAVVGTYRDSCHIVSTNSKGNLSYNGTQLTLSDFENKLSSYFSKVGACDTPNTITTVTGYQTTTVANNKFDLRLVGLVELGDTALTDYSKVGFVVVANYANINTKWTSAASNKVYSSLSGTETDNTANGGTGIVSYEASDFGADYLYALAIKNIPANQGVITLEVTPYYIAADGTTVVYGATENVEIDPATLADNTLANG